MTPTDSSKQRHRPAPVDFLIVGGGLAGATAADTLRREGATGAVMILSEDKNAPYHRPRLSKRYLSGAAVPEDLLVHPLEDYADQKITLRLDEAVTAVDAKAKQVRTAKGETIAFTHLLLAPGAIPLHSKAPGADLPGVFYLHGLEDADALRGAAAAKGRAVIIGASYLGLEVAMTLATLGLDVTLVETADRVLPQLEARELSQFFQAYAEDHGVKIRLNDTVERFIGDVAVKAVETRAGLTLPADLALVAIGIVPDTGFLAGGDIDLDPEGFILADEMLRTNQQGVYAAGDAVAFLDPVFGIRRHVDHWDNAARQGRLAARNMLGARQRFDEVSYFYSEVGELNFDVLGLPQAGEDHIARGSLQDRSFALFYLKDNVIKALFSMGRPLEETRLAEGLIRSHTDVSQFRDKLGDPDFDLNVISAQTVLVLQGGGALGSFECGVIKALEHEGIFPDVVAGVSIGALNGAIVAAHPRDAAAALEAFWRDLTVMSPPLLLADARRAAVSSQVLAFGVPNFFKPRWLPPFDANPVDTWTSFYDVSPMRELISRYVDFKALKTSPVRLLIGAVEVTTGKFDIFDSYVDDLTPDHLLASGSLPPGFPWTMIDGKAYWDGGIMSNSPLDLVFERLGPDGKSVYIVDLFSGEAPLPRNLMEVLARRDEIIYAERVHSDFRTRETVDAYREMIGILLSNLDPHQRRRMQQHPRYIQMMGDGASSHIIRFQRPRDAGEPSSRDYDFSDESIKRHQSQGYALVRRTLAEQRKASAAAEMAATSNTEQTPHSKPRKAIA